MNRLLACLAATCFAKLAFAAPPNVLLIIADDQGYGDCSAYPDHASDIHTPNIDRLAHEGAMFTQGYVSAPVCSPSRTGLMTGRYQERFDKNPGWHTTLPNSAKTIAEHLHALGYATMMIGKNDFGHQLESKQDRRYPMNNGYDHHLGFEAHAHDYFALTEADESSATEPHGDSPNIGPLDFDMGRKDFHGYTTNIFTDHAIDFMKNHGEKPFFCYVAYNAVHDLVQQVPKNYLEKYGVNPIPPFDPKKQSYKQYYNTYNRIGAVSEEQMRRYYLANLNCLDDNVGRLLDVLNSMKLADNTLVLYISDNGGSEATGGNNTPLRGCKNSFYEGGIREPLMARWVGKIEGGRVIDTPVISLDFLPTIVEAASAGQTPRLNGEASVDGVSLLPLLTKGEPLPARNLHWKFQQMWAIRSGDWKLSKTHPPKYPGGSSSWILGGPTSDQPQLFNLKDDPQEQHDVAAEHADVVDKLRSQYKQWESHVGELNDGTQK